jgi:NADH-quinone oxidoreductase subunit G
MIRAIINNIPVECPENTTILKAADMIGVKIPTLCYHKDLFPSAACGICVVKDKNQNNKMIRACCTNITDNMEIVTHDFDIIKTRKTILEMVLSTHPNDCLVCNRNQSCELQQLFADFDITDTKFDKIKTTIEKDSSTKAIVLNPEKCIKCGRCIEVCQNIQDVWALTFLNRGINTKFSTSGEILLSESPCVKCGQCAAHCPVGAIYEYNEIDVVWNALLDKDKYPVVQIAPAVRVAISEAFNLEPGQNFTYKLYSALKRLGFKAVFDTNFGADVTIMEEASEFIERFTKNKTLPLITTCCPSWVDFMEKEYPDMLEHFSSCKSPHEIVGVLSKTYYAKTNGIDPEKMFVTSIMPCTSKKYEITRSKEMYASGYKDVDVVLTTRELIRMIKQSGIDITKVNDELPDFMLGKYTGAGTIFGTTGGVMEAALRTATFMITNDNPKDIEIKELREDKNIKKMIYKIGEHEIKVAAISGLSNVKLVLKEIRDAKKNKEKMPYDFIEIMACEGGCVAGGGQPYTTNKEVIKKRAEALYNDDKKKGTFRCSHENTYIKKLYNEFLQKPLSKMSHELLHTKYDKKKKYKK